MKYVFILHFTLILFACNQSPSHEIVNPEMQGKENQITPPTIPTHHSFSYTLSNPTRIAILSGKLTEISGLSVSPDSLSLVTINDEEGELYFIDKTTGEIIRSVHFGKSGDYEGVETVGDEVYAVKSNGTLFRIINPDQEDPKVEEFNTPLNSKYDVEGLTYWPSNNWLLLACKGKAGDGDKYKGSRAIYAFDLEKKELKEEPVYLINRTSIGKYFKTEDFTEKLVSLFGSEYKHDAFAPSGIAIHPKTSDICIISSVGKLFIILSPDGEILHIEKLDASIFRQPEGICFDKNDLLYISTEGKGGKAKLYQFLPH